MWRVLISLLKEMIGHDRVPIGQPGADQAQQTPAHQLEWRVLISLLKELISLCSRPIGHAEPQPISWRERVPIGLPVADRPY